MDIDTQKFLSENASAIFGVLGVLVGGALSFVAALTLKRREFTLQVWERLLDRRIAAHEDVIALAVDMRVMTGLGGIADSGELRRAPDVMSSVDKFETWLTRFAGKSAERTTWLSTDSKRELNFVQDYLVSLHKLITSIPPEKCVLVGEAVRQDFIDMSAGLEKSAFSFFEEDVKKLKLDSLSRWHKYDRDETDRRLAGTVLFENWDAILSSVRTVE